MDYRVGQAVLGKDEMLESAGLLVDYIKAEGDYVHWEKEPGEPLTPVLDLVGGFGSTLLGHNNRELADVVFSCLDTRRPIQVQGARRGMSLELRDRLQKDLEAVTGKTYELMLLNTGTEAVEAAIKHAEYSYTRRLLEAGEDFSDDIRRFELSIRSNHESLSSEFYRRCERLLGHEPIDDMDALLGRLISLNHEVFNEPCYIAAFKGDFHGKTKGSLATTWNRDARLPFIRNTNTSVFIEDVDEFKEALEKRQLDYYTFEFEPLRLVKRTLNPLAAVLYEPIQGEGGVIELSPAWAELLQFIHEHYPETAIVADEIQCGLGRTGAFLESAYKKLPNDYITFSKSLGGGYCKVSAVAIDETKFFPEFSMLHTSTFSDDDISSAVGRRTLEIIKRDDVPARCDLVGRQVKKALKSLQEKWPDVIADVRGRGCMIGLQLCDLSRSPSATLSSLSGDEMLSIVCAGYLLHCNAVRVMPSIGNRNVIRIQPSAYFSPESLDHLIRAFDDLCRVLAHGDAGQLVGYLVGHQRTSASPVKEHPTRCFPNMPGVRKVGFVSHLISKDSLTEMDPALSALDEFEIEHLNQRVLPVTEPSVAARRYIRSAMGNLVELTIYGIQMDAETIEEDMRLNRAKVTTGLVKAAYKMAREDGCQLVGFGGYTSIVTGNCTQFRYNQPCVTSGNALTVATNLATIAASSKKWGIDIGKAHVAIVGATGNIGEVHSAMIAESCGKLSILGRPGAHGRLAQIADSVVRELVAFVGNDEFVTRTQAGELSQRVAQSLDDCSDLSGHLKIRALVEQLVSEGLISIRENLNDLSYADIIVSATNSASPVINHTMVASDKPVLISDIAIPGDVQEDIGEHLPNVKLIKGGVVNMPVNSDFSLPGMLLEDGQIYACAAETVLLGLAGIERNFSIGPIATSQVREAAALARIHGFELDQEKPVWSGAL